VSPLATTLKLERVEIHSWILDGWLRPANRKKFILYDARDLVAGFVSSRPCIDEPMLPFHARL
jgi:hypothetical protein